MTNKIQELQVVIFYFFILEGRVKIICQNLSFMSKSKTKTNSFLSCTNEIK